MRVPPASVIGTTWPRHSSDEAAGRLDGGRGKQRVAPYLQGWAVVVAGKHPRPPGSSVGQVEDQVASRPAEAQPRTSVPGGEAPRRGGPGGPLTPLSTRPCRGWL